MRKELFLQYIQAIDAQHKLEQGLNEAFRGLDSENAIFSTVTPQYSNTMHALVTELLGPLRTDYLEWWLWDCVGISKGQRDAKVWIDEVPYDVTDPSDLYDFLMEKVDREFPAK